MVMTLKQSIKSTIQKSNWLDELSRWNALDRLNQLRAVIGAPEIYFNSTYLEGIMASVSLIKY